MKKYNTPEMKVSMFDTESITAAEASTTLATYDHYIKTNGITNIVEKDWTELNISF